MPNGSACTGSPYVWTSATWTGKFTPASDTAASVAPTLLAKDDPTGTYNWSVTFSGAGQSVTKTFTVTNNTPQPNESLMISQEDDSSNFNCALGSCSIAQEINPQITFNAVRVGFKFGGTGKGTASISLRTSIDGPILATTENLAILTDGRFTEGELNVPITLYSGKTYYLQVDTVIPSSILFCFVYGNPYPYGIAWCKVSNGWTSNNPSKGDYTFRIYGVKENQPPKSAISGAVTFNGLGLQGVSMTLSGQTSDSTTTAQNGTYTFTNLPNGSYTIIPDLDGYTFNPASIDGTISGSNISGQDFRACDTSVPLSGVLRDATTNKLIPDITIIVDGAYSTVTDSNGYYEVPGLSCGEHTIEVDIPSGYTSYVRTMDISENPTWDIFLTKPETVYGPNTSSGYGPDPVNTATGNYIYQKKDIEVPGRGLSFVFKRYYNSQSGKDGPLGFGWGYTYNAKLTVNADSTVTIRWSDGKTQSWTPDGTGGFTPQYGVFDTLIENGDGTYTLKKKDLTQYNFDSSGRLLSIIDKNGNQISLTYTGNNLTQITDSVGRNIDFAYDENNRITVITDPIERTVQFDYDGNGNLVSSTDMNGNITTYTYDTNHQLLTVVDPRGNTIVTNTYNDQKRVVTSQRDAKGGETRYSYDEVNRKTTVIDALGNTTIHFHDEFLRLIQETDGRGNSTYFKYDSAGNRIEVIDKNGNTTAYTYDSSGNVLTKTDALGNVTTITYDENNNPLTRTDALGNTTTHEYDANGNLVKTTDPLGNVTTISYDPYGQPLTITDARGNTTTNKYDAEGNLIEVTDALGNKTRYTYDGVGRRLTKTDALNRTTTYAYDSNNNLLTLTDPLGHVTTYTYDANGNRLTLTDPMGNTTSYAYDVKDLLTTVTDPAGNSVTNAYDGLDRKISVTDKNGNITHFAYDELGNLVKVTDALGKETHYTYDANGNKLSETDPLGNTIRYTYDALDRLISSIDPLGNTITNTYDALGRVVRTVNAKGQKTDFEYDALGRLTKVTDADSGTIRYTYDANGNQLTTTDPNGNTSSYGYDALNRLIRKTEALGGQYQYTYDAVGNRISLKDPNGNTINYSYDANNRLTGIKYPDGSTVSFSYDANGNRTQMVDNLGITGYVYDALNRMASYTDPFGNTVGYGYDANGNRISLNYPDGKVVTYTYDALNRITTVTDWLTNETMYTYDAAGKLVGSLNPNNTKATYTYDAAGRLTGLSNTKSDSSVISDYTYTLDAIGNHLQVVQDEPLMPLPVNKNITYTYDAENRLIDVGGNAYTYDANGNLIGNGSGAFSYDYEDRLVQSNIGGVVTQYSYDGFGNRLAKMEGDKTTKYVLDINGRLSNVLAETDDTGTITAYYVYGLGLISKVLPDGTASYYHYDSRGSTIAMTDAGQNITDAYAYDTFGNVANSNGSNQNPFKYVGKYGVMDEGNSLYYIRARYYAPELGRFMTKDPQTGNDRDGQSLNRYVYALNNPVVLIDVSGFSALEGLNLQYNLSESTDYEHNNLLLGSHEDTQRLGPVKKIIIEYGPKAEKINETVVENYQKIIEFPGKLFCKIASLSEDTCFKINTSVNVVGAFRGSSTALSSLIKNKEKIYEWTSPRRPRSYYISRGKYPYETRIFEWLIEEFPSQVRKNKFLRWLVGE